MNEQQVTKYKAQLGRYLPQASIDPIFEFMDAHCVQFRITRERHSKLGDYRCPQPHHPNHEISINGNLNPYYFLLVLLHEMAHLNTFLHYHNSVAPHGHEWQEHYRQLLSQYIALNTFPEDVTLLIKKYIRRIPLNHSIGTEIEETLRHYNPDYQPETSLTLNQLHPGDTFVLKARPDQQFIALEHRRTRWKCQDIDTHKLYLVAGTAEVIIG